MAPMGTNYGTTDGYSTDRDKRYYAERAKGGVAMIVTEAMNTSAEARNHNNSLCTYHDSFIPGLAALVKAIHDEWRACGCADQSSGTHAAALGARHGAGRPV